MSGRRRIRRSRSSGGALPINVAWYLIYGDVMDDKASFTEEETREAWRRHRDQVMAWCPPGGAPYALMAFDTASFETIAGVRSLRLELPGLHDARRAFEDMSSVHPDQAEKFERLAGNVRAVIAEFEGEKT